MYNNYKNKSVVPKEFIILLSCYGIMGQRGFLSIDWMNAPCFSSKQGLTKFH